MAIIDDLILIADRNNNRILRSELGLCPWETGLPDIAVPPGATFTSRSAVRIRINFWQMVGLYFSFGRLSQYTWVLKVSIFETGYTRYCSVSGSHHLWHGTFVEPEHPSKILVTPRLYIINNFFKQQKTGGREFRQCHGQKVDVWLGTSPAQTLQMAPSHINRASLGPGIVASDAETLKSAKYAQLPTSMFFVPIAIETFDAFVKESAEFMSELGRRLTGTSATQDTPQASSSKD